VRIPPDSNGYVLIRLRGDDIELTLAGPRASASDVELFPGGLTVAVRFRTGGLQALCQQPACEWLGRTDPLHAVNALEVNRLEAQLASASTLPERLDALNASFKRMLEPSSSLNSTVTAAAVRFTTDAPAPTVSNVAQAVGVSTRHLRTLFQRHVGLAPKAFARIARLHRVVHAQRERPEASWSTLALEAGYYDQSHLIADFQALMDESPSTFRSRDQTLTATI
jgi:methylphosphotriester-DNA--protein-cysteine methyltransferase